jgi:hypothetical protein
MSEEYDNSGVSNESESASPFLPILILTLGVLIWVGYDDFASWKQWSVNAQNVANAEPAVRLADTASQKYVDLVKDLLQTSSTDSTAKGIVNDAIKAGLLRYDSNGTPAANGSTNAAPISPGTDSGTGH